MTDAALATQLMTYADAITGFSWAQAVVFCFAVARDDGSTKAVTKTDGAIATTLGLVAGTGIYALLVFKCVMWAGTLDRPSFAAATVSASVQLG